MQYTHVLNLSIFFTYCFLGWVWESLYVSVRKREWVNRGFLNGPMLPIYGFGSILILWLTLPYKDNSLFIYVLGMLGATILEYATGDAMERMFHMRYWDYSSHPFNMNGHISLFTSLGWGFFSILLVKVLNPPIVNFLQAIPYHTITPIVLVLMIVFAVDTMKSVQAALNMKELMTKLTENNNTIKLLETKLDSVALSISQGSDGFQKHMQTIETDIKENIAMFEQQKEKRKQSRQKFLLERLQEHREKKSRLFDLLNEKADAAIQEVHSQLQSTTSEDREARLLDMLNKLNKYKEGLKQEEMELVARKDIEYKKAANLIRRNPTSASRRFNEAFGEIKSLNEARQKHKKDKKIK